MSLLLALLALGLLSLLERVLLSTVQYRHGPGSQTADGLALLLADGTKLYSKWGTTDRIHTWYLLLTGAIFSLSVLLLSTLSHTALHSWIHTEGTELAIISLSGIILLATLLLPSLTGGVYTQLSTIRALRGGLLADVSMEASIAVILTGQEAGASNTISSPTYWLLPAACWWLTTMIIGGKPPFDLTEAESEMIAGVLTELAGGIFALALLTEGVEIWLLQTVIILYLCTHTSYILLLGIVIISSFVGRILLVRLRVAWIYVLILSRLMFIPVSFTKVKISYTH